MQCLSEFRYAVLDFFFPQEGPKRVFVQANAVRMSGRHGKIN